MSHSTPCTVRSMIENLQQFDPETLVVVDGYEDGYDVPHVYAVNVSKRDDERPYYSGAYGDGKFPAVVVSRGEP